MFSSDEVRAGLFYRLEKAMVFKPGDKVRILAGSRKGKEGVLVRKNVVELVIAADTLALWYGEDELEKA